MIEDQNKVTYFAETNSRGKALPFGIKRRDRARHMYVIGKTGMGKSTLLENMAIQDIRNGEGMAFIDPHGSTAERIMEYVPAHRVHDVVYFAPFDMECPIAFNVMEDVGYDKRHLVVSGLMSAFKKIWEDAWSARMEYILSNTLLALLEYPGATLLDVNRMLSGTFSKTPSKGQGLEGVTDKNAFRYKVVGNIKDPQVRNFWIDEFYGYTERYIQEATPAIQNKVGQFTSNPLIRNIVGQPKSSFDIREIMDRKKILIINLSKGRVGETNAALLGSMLVTKIYLAAMSRADASAESLKALPSFYFYVDEFQNFANESFSDILSEARKYKLNLIIAHQYVEQMEEEVRDAVFGNVGTTVSFRVGPFDAETLETVFAPQFSATDLVNLGFAQIYLTLMIDGVGSPPFSATTLPPFGASPENNFQKAVEASRRQYGKARAEVESAIAQWQADAPNAAEPQKPRYGSTTAKPRAAAQAQQAPRQPQQAQHAAVAPVPVTPAPQAPNQAKAEAPAPQVHAHDRTSAPEQAHRQRSPGSARPPQDGGELRARPPAEPDPQPRPERSFDRAQDRPALEGSTSLRDALAAVTAKKPEPKNETIEIKKPVHKPTRIMHKGPVSPEGNEDLKDALDKVAKKTHKPISLPKDELRAMLSVDPEIEGSQYENTQKE